MLKKTLLLSSVLALTSMLGMTKTALAQSAEGSIRGTVVDPSGALIPDAQVTIFNAAGFSRTIKSTSTGAFEVEHLAPGSYSVSINASGFTAALESDIPVLANRVTAENVKLGISVDQEIDVLA